MNVVKVLEQEGPRTSRPFRVSVDGKVLVDKRGQVRWFKTSFSAAIAGTKEVDQRRAVSEEGSHGN